MFNRSEWKPDIDKEESLVDLLNKLQEKIGSFKLEKLEEGEITKINWNLYDDIQYSPEYKEWKTKILKEAEEKPKQKEKRVCKLCHKKVIHPDRKELYCVDCIVKSVRDLELFTINHVKGKL